MNTIRLKLFQICPKTDRIVGIRKPQGLMRFTFPLVGFLALVWFLVRVAPRPSRATYPCQQVAMPLASGFVLWLTGIGASSLAFRQARVHFRQARYVTGIAALAVALVGVGWAVASQNGTSQAGGLPERVEYDPHPANQPIGVAKGLMPGRVVWVHDPTVTDWDGPGATTLWYNSVNQSVVNSMMSQSVRSYSSASADAAAWDAIFRSFNGGTAGYQAGEKVFIKINLTTSNYGGDGSGCATATYDQKYHPNCWGVFNYSIGPSPQVMYALLNQLVNVAGVAQANITIGDATGQFVNHLYNPLHTAFPNVKYLDKRGTDGRTLATLSATQLKWSTDEDNSNLPDYLLQAAANSKYVIDLAILKTHDRNGITVTAKNHFGSFLRTPDPGTANYYNLHGRLPMQGTWGQAGSMAQYRPLVDLNGHAGMGGKTVLYLLDGIYGGWNWLSAPTKWNMAPFNDDWPSSFFLSMDQVAIDSVAFDILSQQWPEHALANEGVQDYLHEMALANNPPSGTFYDPEGDGSRLASMGVHEHWNNPVEKKYTRNLGTGNGIELVMVSNAPAPAAAVCGSQSILFVTNTISPVPAADQVIITRLTTAGYSVLTKGQSLAVTTDALDKNLVIISETVDAGTVGSKFRDVAVPVILWESGLFDDMQMTSASGGNGTTGSQTQVNVVNSSHPLAAGLSGQVTTSAAKTYSWGVPSSSADIVARLSSDNTKSTIFAYETGRPMVAAATGTDKAGVLTPAPSRRVGFFGGDSLTTDGWKLFDAAVKWAAKCSSASGMMLVDDASGNDIKAIGDGDTINLATLPHLLNIRAVVDPSIVGSMAFSYDGASLYRTDNEAPYLLVESEPAEASPEWTPGLGTHTLTVTPYSSANRGGRPGAEVTISFTVINQPLAVTIGSFSAELEAGKVVLTWETVSELNNRGFNLWRGVSPALPNIQLNTTLIPSQSQGNPSGFTYTWTDQDDLVPGATYYYWLEDVDLSGVVTRHGPVSITLPHPLALTLASFEAVEMNDTIRITWETVSEVDSAGFRLHRSASAGGPRTLVTFVPSQAPGSLQGAVYSYDDSTVQPGQIVWYWLESIDRHGVTALHGPVSAAIHLPTSVALSEFSATSQSLSELLMSVLVKIAGMFRLI